MEKERNEDLNPRSEDIEEKVRQMLDPSIPDVPDLKEVAPDESNDTKEKVVVIKPSPSRPKNITVNETPSAPELPATLTQESKETPLPSKKTQKKVVIPIEHHEEAADPYEPKNPVPQLVKNPPSKITIQDHSEDPDEVAAKLDEAIAELDTTKSKNAESKQNEAEETDLTDISNESDDPLRVDEVASDDTPDTPIEDPEIVVAPETEKAVADIIAKESDEILEIEDAVRETEEPAKPKKTKQRKHPLKALGTILKKPAARWALAFILLAGAAAAATVPTSRYFLLHAAGVRVSSSMTVIDETTQQPLRNAEVRIGEVKALTDETGKVTLQKVRVGPNTLTITKRAYAQLSKQVVLGWGSNPLGGLALKPTGTQYAISVKDFLTGKGLEGVTATSGQADAQSDKDGNIRLSIEKPSEGDITVTLKRTGYRDEELTINPDDTDEQSATLVPSKKHVYISRRSGTYDIYSAYIDGKDEKVVLAGSGNERDDMVLIAHPTDDVAVYVSTRPGQRSPSGEILKNALIIHLDDNETTNIGSSEDIQIISWSGDHLVYKQIGANTNTESADRYQIISYNYKDATTKELTKSNFFNNAIGIGNTVYYAPSNASEASNAKFYKVNVDGTNSASLLDSEVWNIIRTGYDQLSLAVQQEWYEYRVGAKNATKLNTAPANQQSRIYIDSPDGKRSAWVDIRDGKGVLLVYDIATKSEKTIKTESNLGYPVRWLNDSVLVYRIINAIETADYAIDTDGGEAVKIADVTDVDGFVTGL